MTAQSKPISKRGGHWFDGLTAGMVTQQAAVPSLRIADGEVAGHACRVLLVQPDPDSHFPRASRGEVGLLEGYGLAAAIDDAIKTDAHNPQKRALIAIVDVPSQAYGRREEALGLHQALAAAVSAYARARLAGHPVISLLVGKAMSGAFLAHGYQANRIFALADSGVQVHAMGKAAAARVTLRTEEELDKLAADIPPMAYDLESYASLGLLEPLVEVESAESPSTNDLDKVRSVLVDALNDIQPGDTGLERRLNGVNRGASRLVREQLRTQWEA
ncbi:Malonate decarboxylase gamma subunit [Marinobacterium lacunae]|uniref:Malonate decarboxylase gamma subunit n=1 Tax=Marinobacterium lacunae TaxID=1232683 RepID=A0A081FUE1_9GAMM|nr:biotin-independent malonate decarboxylase subunit gamma [Marinobacterium lacunae]KEA62146.1 Malonate decarboxylase gamma subunit [Marinobacterium lacunae]